MQERVTIYPILCKLLVLCFVILFYVSSLAQTDSSGIIINLPNKVLFSVEREHDKLINKIEKKSRSILSQMSCQEEKIYKKLNKTDSLKAKELFAETQIKYKELQNKIESPVDSASATLKEYIPGLDSLSTAFKFLKQPVLDLSPDKLNAIQKGNEQLEVLQGRLQQANEIQAFVREREAQLKTALENTKMVKELTRLNKKVYYYQQLLAEYKNILNDPGKLVQKTLELLNKLPAFQTFMKKSSMLASLFPSPTGSATSETLNGLQTRPQIEQQVAQRLSGSNVNVEQYVQQQTQAAQEELNKLKDKLNQLGGGSGDMTMPEFKPNTQKAKKLFQRLQYGFNLQSQRGNSWLPAMTDFALTLGYKLSDNKIFGAAISYKVGLGSQWSNIRFTSEGIGIRGFTDIKAKGSIWLTAGWEYNYLQRFNELQQIKNIDVWQKSALAGLTKKYKIGKKREGNFQLLYDFLASHQVPRAQAFKFRVGYNF